MYLNRKGTIPSNAVIKKTERRPNPFREKKFDATDYAEKGKTQIQMDDEEGQDEEVEEYHTTNLMDMDG